MIENFLSDLKRLANNLWWCWNRDAKRFFEIIHPALWSECGNNPVLFLKRIKDSELRDAFSREDVANLSKKVIADFDSYMKGEKAWFSEKYKDNNGFSVVYISPEFGIDATLPIYAGGLGILAGDHLKSASDLGIPLIGVGLLYRQGYFIQLIDENGIQHAAYEKHLIEDMPVAPVKNDKGEDLIISIELADRELFAKVWKMEIGRISLYLLDSDIKENISEDRQLTYKLYGGGEEMRISQEILLGIGGARAVHIMGFKPSVWHMNEGHSAFLILERIIRLMQRERLSFYEALEVIKAKTVFTTHTPVPAGNDAFSLFLMDRYFRGYLKKNGIKHHEFMDLGLRVMKEGSDLFSLTVLAMQISSFRNGVSMLHASTSRKMWNDLWHNVPSNYIPIHHITNGIHTRTWLASEMEDLFDRYLESDWKEKIDDRKKWQRIHDIPDKELWDAHNILKKKMIEKIKNNTAASFNLNPDALTICFARRFATYKRADLIFRDIDRLNAIINNARFPVQIIFSGKAHPDDRPGQKLIEDVYRISQHPEFAGRIVFLKGYDMGIAKYLISGAEVWLNTPRKPLEASGTSGQKAAVNGVINLSVLDGWWPEGYNSDTGWAIGDERGDLSEGEQDKRDVNELYKILEEKIIPMYYERDENDVPHRWIKMMKSSIENITPIFSSHRMVKDYTENSYIPASERWRQLVMKNYAKAKELADWKLWMKENWKYIKIVNIHKRIEEKAEEPFAEMILTVDLGPISPSDVFVEVCNGKVDEENSCYCNRMIQMTPEGEIWEGFYTYTTRVNLKDGWKGFSFMVVPSHPFIGSKYDMGLLRSRYIENI